MKTWRWNHWKEEYYLKFECTTQESRIWNGWLGIVVQAQDPLILTSPCLYLPSTSSPSFRSSSSIPAHQSKSLLALTSCPFCMVVNQLCVSLFESVKVCTHACARARTHCTHACARARTHLEDASTVMIANVINKKFVARDLENFGRHVLACSWWHGNQVANAVLVCHPWSSLRRLRSAGSNK